MRRSETEAPLRWAEKKSTLGFLGVSLAVALWGFSAVAVKAVSTTGAVTAFYRLWFAIPILWVLLLSAPRLRASLGREWLFGSLAGGLLFATHQLFFFTAVKFTSIANVTMVGALQPVLVLLVAARLFAEPASWRVIIASVIAVVGTSLVVWGSLGASSSRGFGDVLAVGNLFAFTGYFLVSKRVRQGVGATEYVVGMTTVAGVFMGCACLFLGEDFGSPSQTDLLVIATLALFPGTLGHVLVNWAHAHVSALRISMVLLATPVVASASASASVFLGESLTAVQWLGFGIVLSSIGVVVFSREPSEAESLAEGVAGTEAP